jgi:hypothetical protein
MAPRLALGVINANLSSSGREMEIDMTSRTLGSASWLDQLPLARSHLRPLRSFAYFAFYCPAKYRTAADRSQSATGSKTQSTAKSANDSES